MLAIGQLGQRAQPQGGSGSGLLGLLPRLLAGGMDLAAVVAAVQADEGIAFPLALAAMAADAGRSGREVVVNPVRDEVASPIDLPLAQRRDDVALGAAENIYEGLGRVGLDLKLKPVTGGV